MAATAFNELMQREAKGLERLYDSVEYDSQQCRLTLKKETRIYTFFLMGNELIVHKDSMRGKHLWSKELNLDIKRPSERKYKKIISKFIELIVDKSYELHHH